MRSRFAGTVAALAVAGLASADDWPSRLGPTLDGRSSATNVFASKPKVGLRKAWSQKFEGGRAGIAIANGRVVTLVNDAERDVAIAWDAATGKELWRVDLGPTDVNQYLGPTSTPALDATRAFVLATSCQLRALDAATGKALWTLDLKARFQATPRQGCLTSPLLADGRLVVQTGAVAPEQPRVIAVDVGKGEPVWQTKIAERAPYSSPMTASLAGVPQVLVHHVVSPETPVGGVTALDPKTGAVIWAKTPTASKSNSYEVALPLGGDRLGLMTWNDFAAQAVKKSGDSWAMEELWRSADLTASIAPPVLHEGHLYGFGGDQLACVEAATGKVAWKERLYAGSLMLVDGHLVVLSQASGEVRVVEATPAGYREKAKLQVLNRGGRADAPPSFAGGRIFVRNDEELAAIAIE